MKMSPDLKLCLPPTMHSHNMVCNA